MKRARFIALVMCAYMAFTPIAAEASAVRENETIETKDATVSETAAEIEDAAETAGGEVCEDVPETDSDDGTGETPKTDSDDESREKPEAGADCADPSSGGMRL